VAGDGGSQASQVKGERSSLCKGLHLLRHQSYLETSNALQAKTLLPLDHLADFHDRSADKRARGWHSVDETAALTFSPAPPLKAANCQASKLHRHRRGALVPPIAANSRSPSMDYELVSSSESLSHEARRQPPSFMNRVLRRLQRYGIAPFPALSTRQIRYIAIAIFLLVIYTVFLPSNPSSSLDNEHFVPPTPRPPPPPKGNSNKNASPFRIQAKFKTETAAAKDIMLERSQGDICSCLAGIQGACMAAR
jgi:hypothetical protein